MFEEYKDIFGRPREGVHAYRIADVAFVDVIACIILIIILTMAGVGQIVPVTLMVFLTGIVSHRMFGVRTTIDKLLF